MKGRLTRSLALLAGLALTSAGIAPAFADDSDNLRAMTLNIRHKTSGDEGDIAWKGRFGAVIRSVQANNPDILGTQEGYYSQLRSLETGYNHAGGEEGTAFIRLWEKAGAKIGNDYHRIGQGMGGITISEYNAIYVRKSRFDILEKGNKWYGFDGLKNSAVEAWLEQGFANVVVNIGTAAIPVLETVAVDFGAFKPRHLTYAKLRDKTSGRITWVFNTKMYDNNNPETVDGLQLTAARSYALGQLRQFIFEKATTEDGRVEPVVLLGSYGANYLNLPMSLTLSTIQNGTAMNDDFYRLNARWYALGTLPDESETFHNFGKIAGRFGSPVYPIDWTYSMGHASDGKGLTRKKSAIDKTMHQGYRNGGLVYPSDHYPVITDYSFQ
ncbi:hypothetical protein [Parendozoicomonas haliclonae]|uniref:Endonuclease/Exonuclease/phosphatase family protein n=1 Tax=Parendozoicomonas haliclonae TaxID=1960125 RepID=A0A1X7ADW3_9GAMM|nr:hypothetical protein [Parendozoicomonas haliclonae]SMA32296.1 hypothetical protein EHSB41UT_00136 [Parendozoicomonas haliclonae]